MNHRPRYSYIDEGGGNSDAYGDIPPRAESIFMPLLLCIQFCLLFEVLTLWVHEYALAGGFRVMIGVFICVAHHFRSKEALETTIYTHDLAALIPMVAAQDVLVAVLMRGLFNLYSWLVIYTPIALYYAWLYRESRWVQMARDYVSLNRMKDIYVTMIGEQQQNEDIV